MKQQVKLTPDELDAVRFALFQLSKKGEIFPDYAAVCQRLYDFVLGFESATIRCQL